jgi:hypothetical protein
MKNLGKIAILCLLASCSTTIKNFDKYEKQFAQKTSFMPSAESLKGASPKVVVFEFNENNNEVAKNATLGATVANSVENVLTKDRLIEMVDRSVAEKLKKEITLAEVNNKGSYKGPKVADYAISGSISNADFSSKYSAASTYFDAKAGRMVSVPAKFTYKSNVSGNIKIYELPSLAVIENVEFSGANSRNENVQQKGGLSFAGLKIGGEEVSGAQRDDGLVRSAAQNAVNNAKVSLKNIFAKKGYILEKRTFEDKTIFKITLGSQDGIKQDDEFEVMGQFEVQNDITGETEVERRIIASGKVADKIDPKTAWVVLNEKEKVSQVRIGDTVKIKYSKSYLDHMSAAAALLPQN